MKGISQKIDRQYISPVFAVLLCISACLLAGRLFEIRIKSSITYTPIQISGAHPRLHLRTHIQDAQEGEGGVGAWREESKPGWRKQ